MSSKNVLIYCSSSNKIAEHYRIDTKLLVDKLMEKNCRVICGGGTSGLMGCVADTVSDYGGQVVGVRPSFLNDLDQPHSRLTELVIVDDIFQRKREMLKMAEVVIILPGGSGTLQEMLEVITLKRLGQFNGPIVLLNTRNYFGAFIDLFENMVKDGFMHDIHRSLFLLTDSVDSVIDYVFKEQSYGVDYLAHSILK
jgi:uncharacterized protein (TIGR00730 family)